MRPSINVIDLDKTLIPYDSFRVLVMDRIKRLNVNVIFWTFLRVIRFDNQYSFKCKVTAFMEKRMSEEQIGKFVSVLLKDIDRRVMNEITTYGDEDQINILLSASPDFYVSRMIKELGWRGQGSYFDSERNFYHLYGEQKISWLIERFPPQQYNYNLAISDSSTDDELLNMFKNKIKWISH